jgi:hypothetical protein
LAAVVGAVGLPGVLALSRAAARVIEVGETTGSAHQTAGPRDITGVAVLIPARDEETHIPALLEDLGRQDLDATAGRVCLRVVVVDDRSLDRTGVIASEAMARASLDGLVIRRNGPHGTKSDALREVPAEAIGDAGLQVVLDADARVSTDFVRGVVEHHGRGNAAFTARRRITWADRFWPGRVQDDEQALDSWILAGRIGLGGAGELRGNGMVITTEALAAAGGWPAGVLAEDLEVSAALLATGTSIAWAGHLVVEETAAGTPAALGRQRVRWAEGSARRFITRLPAALAARRAPRGARMELALYACQLLLPPLILGASLRGILTGRFGPAAVLVTGYVGTAGLLAWSAIGGLQEPAPPGSRAVRALAVGVFSCHWLVALPVGLVRIAVGPEAVTFARTRDRFAPRAHDSGMR